MLVVEALLRTWRVGDAVWRLRLRLVPLAVPLVLVPLYFLLAPWRAGASFASSRALFAGERWNLLRVGSAGAGDLLLAFAAGLGAWLFLRDALPPILDRLRQRARPAPEAWLAPPALQARVERHARRLGLETPAIRVVRSRWPVFFAEGWRPAALVVSAAALDLLAPPELDAAIAHELAHVRHADPAWGYGLIAVRAANFFNPALHWGARAVVDELERRADQVVVGAGHRPDSLASAIVKLFDHAHPEPSGALLERLARRVRLVGVERRRERLVEASPPAPLSHGWLRLGLTAVGLAVLLYFVV
jgi:Zn-dependent protease with chaperone function